MRVLVTGAAGFAARHLCDRLTREGYQVRGLIRDAGCCAELRQRGVEPVIGDIRDRDSLQQAVEGVNTVYHIAASYRRGNVSRKEMWDINVQGTRNVLDAAVKAGVRRLVHCSTVGVHGDIKNPPASEETPYDPGDYYQESKAEGERLALQYMNQLPIVVFRPGAIYGPGDLRFLKLFKAIKRKRFIMLGSGQVSYHMIYIDDLVEGILRCGTSQKSVGRVYILAGESAASLNDIVKTIGEVLDCRLPTVRFPVTPVYLAGLLCEVLCKPWGINPPLYRRRVDFFRKNRAFDISRAKRELNFAPKVDLKTGIGLTADWYQVVGLL
jgi:nucleoside-diphosphate-sugar epimerase